MEMTSNIVEKGCAYSSFPPFVVVAGRLKNRLKNRMIFCGLPRLASNMHRSFLKERQQMQEERGEKKILFIMLRWDLK